MIRRRVRALLVSLALAAALPACGQASSGADAGFHWADATVDVAWGGPDAPKPGNDLGADLADPSDVPDLAPEGRDAAPDGTEPADATEPAPDAKVDGAPDPGNPESALDTVEPSPDAATDVGGVEPSPDLAEPVPDVAPDLPPDEPDLPPVPDSAECSVDAHCSDGVACTADTCVAGVCKHAPIPDQGPCEDGDSCTTGDYCLSGLCFAGAVTSCDDGNACTGDQCVSGAGCKHTPKTGGSCNDGDPCSGNDTCVAGTCQKGALDLCPICGDGKCGEPYETCEDCTLDCGACNETQCADGVDEDWDGSTDCDDADCAHVLPCYEAACSNGQDDDADGVSDCADPDCGATEPCIETSCADGQDNDTDGATDCADSQCAAAAACVPAACASVVALSCGQSKDGSTGSASNHLSGYSGCSSQGGSNADVLYAVVLPAGKTTLTAKLTIDDTDDDLDLYVLKDACAVDHCVDSSTSTSSTETASATGTPGQIFFVIVEEWGSVTWGDFALSITCN